MSGNRNGGPTTEKEVRGRKIISDGGGVAARHLRVKVRTRNNPKYGNSERVEINT